MKKKLIPIISILIAFGLTSLIFGYIFVGQTNTVTQTSPVLTPIPSTQLKPGPEIYAEDLQTCEVSFVLAPNATPTTTPSPTPTPSPRPTPTVQPGCYQTCSIDSSGSSNCPAGLACIPVNGQYKCANTTCPQSQSCVCPTAVPSPTATPIPTQTPTPKPGCYGTCTSSSDCPSDLSCRKVNGTNRCVNINCSGESDCACNTTTPKEPELPKAGGIPPTVIFAIGGIVIVLLGLIF